MERTCTFLADSALVRSEGVASQTVELGLLSDFCPTFVRLRLLLGSQGGGGGGTAARGGREGIREDIGERAGVRGEDRLHDDVARFVDGHRDGVADAHRLFLSLVGDGVELADALAVGVGGEARDACDALVLADHELHSLAGEHILLEVVTDALLAGLGARVVLVAVTGTENRRVVAVLPLEHLPAVLFCASLAAVPDRTRARRGVRDVDRRREDPALAFVVRLGAADRGVDAVAGGKVELVLGHRGVPAGLLVGELLHHAVRGQRRLGDVA